MPCDGAGRYSERKEIPPPFSYILSDKKNPFQLTQYLEIFRLVLAWYISYKTMVDPIQGLLVTAQGAILLQTMLLCSVLSLLISQLVLTTRNPLILLN